MCQYEEGENLRTLICNHVFHKDCVDKWLVEKRKCPLCNTRQRIDED